MKKTKKKILIIVICAVILITAIPLLILFTGPGNMLLIPFVESEINKQSPIKITLTKLRLYPSYIKIKGTFAKASSIEAEGAFHLTSKEFDIDYKLQINDLKSLDIILKKKLCGQLNTEGKIKGTPEAFNINGKSNFARSLTHYSVQIKNQKLQTISVDSTSLHVEDVLSTLCKPLVFSGILDFKIKADQLNEFPENLLCTGNLNLTNGIFNNNILSEKFNINLTERIPLGLSIVVSATADQIKYSMDLASKLASCNSKGFYFPKEQKCDIEYFINTTNLELLKPFINYKLNGELQTSGTVKGKTNDLQVNGTAAIAKGTTTYNITLKHFHPRTAKINITDINIAKLFYCLDKPIYANGNLQADADIEISESGLLNGIINTKITEGSTIAKTMLKQFNLQKAIIDFNLNAKTEIQESISQTKSLLKSTAGILKSEKTIYNIKDKSLNSDFEVYIPDLNSIYFATKRHMQGNIKITGDIKKQSDLEINAHTNTLGGKIEIKLLNNLINAESTGLQTNKLLKTLIYPEIFDSTLNAILTYNLKNKTGDISAELLNGSISKGSFSQIIKQTTQFDITKEIYKKAIINGTIKKSVFKGDLAMQSKQTEITANDAIFNIKNNKIKANLKIKVKKKPFIIKVKGDIKNPHIGIDITDLLSDELEKKIEKQVPKKHKKAIKAIFDIIKDNL
jgi:hypothetical protein